MLDVVCMYVVTIEAVIQDQGQENHLDRLQSVLSVSKSRKHSCEQLLTFCVHLLVAFVSLLHVRMILGFRKTGFRITSWLESNFVRNHETSQQISQFSDDTRGTHHVIRPSSSVGVKSHMIICGRRREKA